MTKAKQRPLIKNNVVWRSSTLLSNTARRHNGFLLFKAARRVLDGWLQVVWPVPFYAWRRFSRRSSQVVSWLGPDLAARLDNDLQNSDDASGRSGGHPLL